MHRDRIFLVSTVILSCILLSSVYSEPSKDPLVADHYTLIPGNRTTRPDTLIGEHNAYIDFAARNEDSTVNAVVEIPAGTNAKWETDVKTGRLFWQLLNNAPRTINYLGFPCNYGMVPRTKGGDGDPFDILVLGGPLLRGAVTPVRIIGIMFVNESGLTNHKLLSVLPGSPMGGLKSPTELIAQYPGLMDIMRTWFTNFKGVNGGFTIEGFGNADTANALLNHSIIDTNAVAMPATYAESANDSLVAQGFTRTSGAYGVVNGVLGSCDTLTGDKDMYRNFTAVNDDSTMNAVIEIPAGTTAKWETAVQNGKFFWENKSGNPRFNKFLGYPGNYGMIPRTIGGDGDPLDVIVLGDLFLRGNVVPVKLIGVMFLVDQGLLDDKLIAVAPGSAIDKVKSIKDLHTAFPGVTSIIETWFTNYKGIGGGLSSNGFGEIDTARIILDSAISRWGDPVKKRSVRGQSSFMFQCTRPGRSGEKASVSFSLPSGQRVIVSVYEFSGKRVAMIANTRLEAGPHLFSWNVRDMRSGCYIIKLQAGTTIQVKNLFLSR
jgi:inorganic pyrophosphatase